MKTSRLNILVILAILTFLIWNILYWSAGGELTDYKIMLGLMGAFTTMFYARLGIDKWYKETYGV